MHIFEVFSHFGTIRRHHTAEWALFQDPTTAQSPTPRCPSLHIEFWQNNEGCLHRTTSSKSLTRSSATAERQRVSFTRLSRLTHGSCTSLTIHWTPHLFYNHRRSLVLVFGGAMASAGARAYNGGLGAEPPAGSRGRAPGQGVRGQSPPEAENLLDF